MWIRVDEEDGKYKIYDRTSGMLKGTLIRRGSMYELRDGFGLPIETLILPTEISLQVGVVSPTTTGNAPKKVKLYAEKLVAEGGRLESAPLASERRMYNQEKRIKKSTEFIEPDARVLTAQLSARTCTETGNALADKWNRGEITFEEFVVGNARASYQMMADIRADYGLSPDKSFNYYLAGLLNAFAENKNSGVSLEEIEKIRRKYFPENYLPKREKPNPIIEAVKSVFGIKTQQQEWLKSYSSNVLFRAEYDFGLISTKLEKLLYDQSQRAREEYEYLCIKRGEAGEFLMGVRKEYSGVAQEKNWSWFEGFWPQEEGRELRQKWNSWQQNYNKDPTYRAKFDKIIAKSRIAYLSGKPEYSDLKGYWMGKSREAQEFLDRRKSDYKGVFQENPSMLCITSFDFFRSLDTLERG